MSFTHGTPKTDRTGTGTRQRLRPPDALRPVRGFPLVTTKKVHFRSDRPSSSSGSCAATRTSAGCRSTASRSGTSGPTQTASSVPSTACSGAAGRRREGGHVDQIAEVVTPASRGPRLASDRRQRVERRGHPADGPGPVPRLLPVLRGRRRTPLVPALPAQRRHLPRRAVQHRQLRAADAHARAAVRPRARRLRLDGRRLPHLRQPPRAGGDATRARPVSVSLAATSSAGPSRSSTTSSRTSRCVDYQHHPAIKAPVAV